MNIDLIGVSVVTDEFPNAKFVTEKIKETFSIPIIWGGAHPSISPEECLKYADIVCIGEGEEALLELCEKIDTNSDYTSVKNLWIKKDNIIITNEVRSLVENLDEFPFPDFELKNKYILTFDDHVEFAEGHMENTYNLMTSRGCPHSCSYCYNNQRRKMYSRKGKYLRFRSVNNVIDELILIKSKFKSINYINFWDDNLVSRSIEELERFSEFYKQRVNLPFYCLASPGKLNEEKIRLLKACGLNLMQIGVQTGSKAISRDIYHRHDENKVIINLANLLHKYKVQGKYDIIFNNPYETKKNILETINLLLKLPKPWIINGYNLVFYPGTEIYEKALKDGYIHLNNIDENSSIYSPINSPLDGWNNKLSNRLYFCNYSIENKRYLNSLIALIPYYPYQLIKLLSFNENVLTKAIVRLLMNNLKNN